VKRQKLEALLIEHGCAAFYGGKRRETDQEKGSENHCQAFAANASSSVFPCDSREKNAAPAACADLGGENVERDKTPVRGASDAKIDFQTHCHPFSFK